jgi:hypothetical protein
METNAILVPGKQMQSTLQCTARSVMWVFVWGNVPKGIIQRQTTRTTVNISEHKIQFN